MENLSINPYLATYTPKKDTAPEPLKPSIKALKQESKLLKIPPELMCNIVQNLPHNDIISLSMTCQLAYYKCTDIYKPWLELFENKVEAYNFMHEEDGISYTSDQLRAIVRQHLANEINIPKGVHIPSVAKLLESLSESKKEPDILVGLHLLKREQFEGVALQPVHKQHLLSDGVILRLVCGIPVDLKALSYIEKEHIELGIEGAIYTKQETIIAAMVQSGLFINTPDSSTMTYGTPLHFAAKHGNKEIVKTLLELGAQPSLSIEDCDGKTPLDLAQARGHTEVVHILSHVDTKNFA